ncbi:MAG: glycosyltransferase [Anaerolineaceae bacterium]|nr:glycosyltransferase [Anaerolineaceae bacterium]
MFDQPVSAYNVNVSYEIHEKTLWIMTQNQPFVSIGLPIYNAERLVRRAIDTLLAQDYPNFELIICDNNSTDDTWNICQEYQSNDSRIRLYRNSTNIGASANFERVFSLATGEYFVWTAHDDWWEPTFISKCVAKLQAHPDSPLCHVLHVEVDEVAGESRAINYPVDLENPSVWQRTYNLLTAWPMPNVYIYGIFRREMLNSLMPVVNITGGDTVLLLKAVQLGVIVGVDETLHKYSVGRRGRGLRLYIQQFAPNISQWRTLTWDWQLFFILAKLSQTGAPNLRSRLSGISAAASLVHRYTGWPLSIKMILNILYILMPESLASGLRRWLDNHSRVEKMLMRLIKNQRALAK